MTVDTIRDPTAAWIGTACAGLMIAQQLGGKAIRDALFLSHFPADQLPKVMVAGAFVSLIAVVVVSALMTRLGPVRVAPIAFGLHAAAFAAEGIWLHDNPKIVAILIYLHIAAMGATVISTFWSVINERFDPRTARRLMSRIVAGATFGGLLGAVVADQTTGRLGVRAMFPILAACNLGCALLITFIGRSPTAATTARTPSSDSPAWWRDKLLQNVSVLVLVLALASSLADYALKSEVAAAFDDEASLVRFFSLFYAGVALVTFIVQALLAKPALQKAGLGPTLAALPLVLLVTGGIGAFVSGLWSVVLLRGSAGILENSLFRAGYELLYAPVDEATKRAAKTWIDVGANRIGDAIGGAVVMIVLMLVAAPQTTVIVTIAALSGLIGAVFVRRVAAAYVDALAGGLRRGLVRLEMADIQDATTRRTFAETNIGLDRTQLLEEIERFRNVQPAEAPVVEITAPHVPASALINDLQAIASRNGTKIRTVLRNPQTDVRLVAHLIELLTDPKVETDVRRALRRISDRTAGQLMDTVCDLDVSPEIRCAVVDVLGSADPTRVAAFAAPGLLSPTVEVRYWCAQLLLRCKKRNPELRIDPKVVQAALRQELDLGPAAFRARTRIFIAATDRAPYLGAPARHRIDARIELAFALMGLLFDPVPIHWSLEALATEESRLRGTALEYLQTSLDADLWSLLRPIVEGPDRVKFWQPPSKDRVEVLLRTGPITRNPGV